MNPLTPNGFVVAMRARLIVPGGDDCDEWMIVSRWGAGGQHLSIGWTSTPAVTEAAPIGLTPCQTAFATCVCGAWPLEAAAAETFQLNLCLPQGLGVAGDFVAARGFVRLYGSDTSLRIRSVGSSQNPDLRAAWDLDAARASWVGEFIEGGGAAGR